MKTEQLPKPARKILTQIYNEMKDVTVILDAGHGYNTPGKQWTFEDGTHFEEWEFNREICELIGNKLIEKGIKFKLCPDTDYDIPLKQRVALINEYPPDKTFIVSVHSNAGGGEGSEVFISKNHSVQSLKIATFFYSEYKNEFPNNKWRGIKKENFTIISETNCPAVLFENFFMDNYKEVTELLNTKHGRKRIANFHVKAIERVVNELY